MRVGITGHQRLDDESLWSWVDVTMRAELARISARTSKPADGLSCLAAGADQLFARAILDSSGRLHVIRPFVDLERSFASPTGASAYRELLAKAATVETIPPQASDAESYLLAGQRVANRCELLIAVWNGLPARGLGGTADIVAFAQRAAKPVVQLDPRTLTVKQM